MKLINWVQLILLVGLISLGVFASLFEQNKLNECAKEIRGIIVDKYEIRNRGYFIKYKYYVENQEYYSSESLDSDVEVNALNIGDSLKILISCDDASISEHKPLWALRLYRCSSPANTKIKSTDSLITVVLHLRGVGQLITSYSFSFLALVRAYLETDLHRGRLRGYSFVLVSTGTFG